MGETREQIEWREGVEAKLQNISTLLKELIEIETQKTKMLMELVVEVKSHN